MQRVLIFDLGGVLLPFDRQLRIDAMSHALKVAPAAVEAFTFSGVAERLDRGEIGLIDLAAEMGRLAGRSVSTGEARALLLSVFETPNTVLWDLAAGLRPAVTTAVLSDNPSCVLDVFPRHDAFDAVFLSAELGITKPAPAVFDTVTSRLGVEPKQITFVDDSETNVVGAGAVGWDAIQFSSNEQVLGELARRGFHH